MTLQNANCKSIRHSLRIWPRFWVTGAGAVKLLTVGFLFLCVNFAEQTSTNAQDRPYEAWLDRKLVPDREARDMIRDFIERQLQPVPLPETREGWLERRDALRQQIMTLLGLDDLGDAHVDAVLVVAVDDDR